MYGAPLPVASKKRKSKKKATSEVVEDEEASEPQPKKAKKEKVVQEVGSPMPTIQNEVQDLGPVKILNQRTRGGSSTESSRTIPPQPKIQKKNKKKNIRKLKVSDYVLQEDEEIEVATDLVTREVRRKS